MNDSEFLASLRPSQARRDLFAANVMYTVHPVTNIRRMRRLVREIKWFVHRGRHGWAPRDTWSLDDYLARVISESVKHLRDTSHGHPGDICDCVDDHHRDCNGMQRWNEILDEIIEGFEASRDPWGLFGESYDAAKAKRDRSLELLKRYWTALWD